MTHSKIHTNRDYLISIPPYLQGHDFVQGKKCIWLKILNSPVSLEVRGSHVTQFQPMRWEWKSVGILGKVSIPDKRQEMFQESTLLLYFLPHAFQECFGTVRCLEMATNHHPWKCHHYLRMAGKKEEGMDPNNTSQLPNQSWDLPPWDFLLINNKYPLNSSHFQFGVQNLAAINIPIQYSDW